MCTSRLSLTAARAWRSVFKTHNTLPDMYDSVAAQTKDHGGCVHYPEYMIGNNIAAIPEYVIEYTHKEECRCSQCELCV